VTNIIIEKRKHVLWLQWLLVVAIAYLLYFGGFAQTASPFAVLALIGVNAGLNASLLLLPSTYFHSRIFDSVLFFSNLVMVSLAIYLTGQSDSDFYLFFFLVLMMAAAGQNFKTFFLVLMATIGLYILMVYRAGVFSLTPAFLIRIPFLFIVGIFFGYLLYIQKFMAERLQSESEFTADLFEFGKALAQAEDLPILYSKIPKLINEIMMSDACELVIIDSEQIIYRCSHEELDEVPTVDISESIHAASYRTDEIFISSALQQDSQFTEKQDFCLYPYPHYMAKSWKPEGHRAGLLAVYRNGKEKWNTHDIKKFQFLTDQTVLGLQYVQVLKEFQKQARVDGLTGLANYRYFSKKFEEEFVCAQREKTPLSLVLMDVDHFKSINDTKGHAAGDRILRSLAAVLKDATPSMDLAGRCGGDEFSVLLPKTDTDEALDVCQRLIEKVKTLNQIPRFSISVGCSTFPHDADSAPKLFAHADRALYSAKARGRGCVCHYGETSPDVGTGARGIRPVQSEQPSQD
jgi:diguanylate cyclase (GGDEF)-like protein